MVAKQAKLSQLITQSLDLGLVGPLAIPGGDCSDVSEFFERGSPLALTAGKGLEYDTFDLWSSAWLTPSAEQRFSTNF